MALPLLFSLLGSGLAGASAIGLSPLLAGSLGAGIGSAIQSGDLEEGLKTGLTAGLLGGIGGALTGGLGGAAGAGTQAATNAATSSTGAVSGPMAQSLRPVARPDALLSASSAAPTTAATSPGGGGLMSMFKDMPSGMSAVQAPAEGLMSQGLGGLAQRGIQQGVMSGAGLGTAAGALYGMRPQMPEEEEEFKMDKPEPKPAIRQRLDPGPNYRPGIDPEFSYFSPSIHSATSIGRLAGGGRVQYNVPQMGPVYMAAGGIADMAGEPAPQQPNEKEIVQLAVRAIRGEIPEQQAAIILAQFVQAYGEDALVALANDVESGRADGPRGDIEGAIKGAGDGMSDMVPARMDDGSQDVLLSNDEFIVPADVVSGIGNGSSEAGADELYAMMDRVRQERTGKKEQPKPIAAGGMLPA